MMTKSPLTTLPPPASSSSSTSLLLSQSSECLPTITNPTPGGTGTGTGGGGGGDDPAVHDDYDDGHDRHQEQQQQKQQQQQRSSVVSVSRNSSSDLHSSIVSEITMDDSSSFSFAGVDNLSFSTSTASLLTSNSARFAPFLPLPLPSNSSSRRRYSKTTTTTKPAPPHAHQQNPQKQHRRRRNHQDHRLVPPVRHESLREGTDAAAAVVAAAAAATAAAFSADDDDDGDDGINKNSNPSGGGGPTPKRESICISSFLPNAAELETSADAADAGADGEDDVHDESFHVLQLHHKAKGTTTATAPTGRNTNKKPSTSSSFDDSLDPLMAAMQISSSRRNSNFAHPSVAAAATATAATASASEAPPVQPRRLSSINGDFDRSQFAPTLPSFSETPNGHSSSSSSSSTSSTKDKKEEETSNTATYINSTDTIVGDDDGAAGEVAMQTPPGHHHQKSSSTKPGKMMKGRRHGTAGTTTATPTLSNQQQRRPSHDDSMVMSHIQKKLVMSSITMDSALMMYDNSGHSQTNSTNWNSSSSTAAAPASAAKEEEEEEEVARPSKQDIYDGGDHDEEDDDGNDIWEEDMTDSGIRNEQTTASPSSPASRSTRSSSIVVPPVHSEARFVSSPIPTNHHGSSSLQVPKRRESSLDNHAGVLEAAAATTAFRSTSAAIEVADSDSLTNRTSDDLHSNTKRRIREAPPALPERQLSIDDFSFDPYVPDVIPELGSDHPDDDYHPIIDFSSPRNNNKSNTKRQSSSRFSPTKISPPSRPGMAGKDLSSSTLPTQAMTATSSHTFATTQQYFNGADSSRCMYDDSFSRDV